MATIPIFFKTLEELHPHEFFFVVLDVLFMEFPKIIGSSCPKKIAENDEKWPKLKKKLWSLMNSALLNFFAVLDIHLCGIFIDDVHFSIF